MEKEPAYDEIYSTCMAPALTAFTTWILEQAAMRGIKRIYFLAQNSYPMYHIAQMRFGETREIELRYLYVSQDALQQAEYLLLGEKCLEIICGNEDELSPQEMMKRAGLTDDEAEEILELTAPGKAREELLRKEKLLAYRSMLGRCKQFLHYVQENSYNRYRETFGYLQQEGLMEHIKYAIADGGWCAAMQRSLFHLLGREFDGFYFGLYQIPECLPASLCHTYYFSPQGGLKRKVDFDREAYRKLTAPPHGTVTGYACITGKDGRMVYQPRCLAPAPEESRQLEKNRILCLQYVQTLPDGTQPDAKEGCRNAERRMPEIGTLVRDENAPHTGPSHWIKRIRDYFRYLGMQIRDCQKNGLPESK